MAKIKKKCRVCGKEYTPCGYCENDRMAFHYRTICCSGKCAQVYLSRVLEARNPKVDTTVNTTSITETVQNEQLKSDDLSEQTLIRTTAVENDKTLEKSKRKYIRKNKIDEKKEQIE